MAREAQWNPKSLAYLFDNRLFLPGSVSKKELKLRSIYFKVRIFDIIAVFSPLVDIITDSVTSGSFFIYPPENVTISRVQSILKPKSAFSHFHRIPYR